MIWHTWWSAVCQLTCILFQSCSNTPRYWSGGALFPLLMNADCEDVGKALEYFISTYKWSVVKMISLISDSLQVYLKNKVYPIAVRLPPGCVARHVLWRLDRLRSSFFPRAVRKVSFTLIHPECCAIKWDLQFTIGPASKHLEGKPFDCLNWSHRDCRNTDKLNICDYMCCWSFDYWSLTFAKVSPKPDIR